VRRLTYRGDYNATPAWSPNGEWIAYAARTGTNLDLYLIDPDSGYTAPLVVHARSDESPSWSPDGRKIAFTSDRRGRREIYTIDLNGRNLRRLTQDFGNCSNAAWASWFE
jgi:TolB protein